MPEETWDEEGEEWNLRTVEACYMACAPLLEACYRICAVAVGTEDEYYGTWYDHVEEEKLEPIEWRGEKKAIEDAKKLAEEKGVPVTLDIPSGRVLVRPAEDGPVVVGMIPRNGDEEKCSLIGSHRVARKDKAVICVSEEALRRWGRATYTHPAVLTYFAAHRKYIGIDYDVTVFAEGGIKGVFDEYRKAFGLNRVWTQTNLYKIALGVDSPGEVAREEIHVLIHEFVHYLDWVNMRPYRGGWMGEGGLSTFGALLGIPVPAGSEKDAEALASEALELLEDVEPAVIESYARRLAKEAEELKKEEKWIGPLARILDRLMDEEKAMGVKVLADIDNDELVIEVIPGSHEAFGLKRPERKEEPEGGWFAGILRREEIVEEEKPKCELLARIIREELEKAGVGDELSVECEVERGWLIDVPYTTIRVPYGWRELGWDADLDLTVEEW